MMAVRRLGAVPFVKHLQSNLPMKISSHSVITRSKQAPLLRVLERATIFSHWAAHQCQVSATTRLRLTPVYAHEGMSLDAF